MKIQTVLDQIDLGAVALPEFQRGYVWNRDQVRGLMDSLYKRHPVGSLLVWVTRTEDAPARGDAPLAPGSVKLLLDGQQRITSLYGIIRGSAPRFFDGNEQSFTGLYFNLDDESFEFYAPLKMRDNPKWVNVTELMQHGAGTFMRRLLNQPGLDGNIDEYLNRLSRIDNIKQIDLHIEEVAGEDKNVDVVVEIFNKVNSGGTKLSKGDLALAKICAEWPEARDEMKLRLTKWRNAGYNFRLEWLLRCVNTIVTGEALFSALADVEPEQVRDGMNRAEASVDTLLNVISSRLGLDHDRVLGSRYSFPLMARYLDQRNGKFLNYQERDKMLYWYVHSFLWGRYAGSTETVLNQDLALIDDIDGGLDRLIGQLRQNRGDLQIQPNDFRAWSRGARFYPLLYMLTRALHARDWGTGVELRNELLGRLTSLQVHHIFPKALLYRHEYSRADVNALANFTFLTQDTNLQLSDRDPVAYFEEVEERQPGALASHWIPMERQLWKAENYLEFLEARRVLLAEAANNFLNELISGTAPESTLTEREIDQPRGPVILEDEIDQELTQLAQWVSDQGLPEGEHPYELTDPETNVALAVYDLAWPDGLQEGFSQGVVLLLEHDEDAENEANTMGLRYFRDIDEFKRYVEREILARGAEEAAD